MSLRHRSREVAFQFLYQSDPEKRDLTLNEIKKEIHSHFEHFETPVKSRTFSEQLILGCIENRKKLDAVISEYAQNWKIDRVSPIERNVLRMAVYELIAMPDIGAAVTIDEAVEIGKEFGSEETSSFVHGILDSVVKNRDSILKKFDFEPKAD